MITDATPRTASALTPLVVTSYACQSCPTRVSLTVSDRLPDGWRVITTRRNMATNFASGSGGTRIVEGKAAKYVCPTCVAKWRSRKDAGGPITHRRKKSVVWGRGCDV